MAIAYQSKTDNGAASGTTIVVSKPDSVVAGDLLIAHLAVGDATASFTGLNGFTSILETVGSGIVSRVCFRVADGTESSSFTFTTNANGSGDNKIASILRFTGARKNPSLVISSSNGQANSASTTVTSPGVTPIEADSMLVFFATLGANATTSGYSISVSNPTWAEVVDGSQGALAIANAYALRTPITATGNGTATASTSTANIGQMIVISEMPTFSVSDTTTTSDSQLLNLSMLNIDNISTSDVLISERERLWTEENKNQSIWTEENK